MSTKIQGVAVPSKYNSDLVPTKGDPFLPVRFNEGTRDHPRFFDLRVFAKAPLLERFKAYLAERRSVIVRSSGVNTIMSAYQNKEGVTIPDLAYSTDLKRVDVYDNEQRAWRPAKDILGA